MTVRHFGKTDMDAFRFTDTFVKSADYAALEAEVSVQKDIVVRMRKLNSKVIAERDEGWNRIAALEARCREIREALRKLTNEVGGCLRGFEPETREAIGNTNWECVMLRVREAADLLLTPQETRAVNPTHQHREFCGALRGMPCVCDATPLETACEHRYVDARNQIVESGEVCLQCGSIRPSQANRSAEHK